MIGAAHKVISGKKWARTVDCIAISLGTGKSPVSRRKTLVAELELSFVYQNMSQYLYITLLKADTFRIPGLTGVPPYLSIFVILYPTDDRVTPSIQAHLLSGAIVFHT